MYIYIKKICIKKKRYVYKKKEICIEYMYIKNVE